jgi:hypothetical protein
MKVATLSVLLLLTVAVPVMAQVPDELLIVPGQRIGRVRLDSSIDDIIQLYGSPSQISENPPASLTDSDLTPVTLYYWKGVALIIATRDRAKVEYLLLDATVPLMRSYKTDRGIARDTPRAVLERAYGQPTARSVTLVLFGRPTEERWVYDTIGLVVFMLVDSVHRLGIFRPGEARTYWRS